MLAHLGHCAGCHSAPGGPPYAGGAPLVTPFGTVYGGNLTPDPDTGLGRWTAQDFWQALHHGRSRDGRLLNPAFPYENFSLISRDDSDALYAYLQSLPAVRQVAPAHELRFPANTQWGLALWRALHFTPAPEHRSAGLPRGEYWVRGLGHCSACHAPRNALGAQTGTDDFRGASLPGGRAYAPPLPSAGRADAGPWTPRDLVDYLKTGHSRQGAALGVMAEVVVGSTQHVDESILQEMAQYLLSRNPPPLATAPRQGQDPAPSSAALLQAGERLYGEHCATCHGEQGQGQAGLYPPLAGNPRVARDPSTNLIRIILEGGFGPATPGHPRPFGMPPFGHVLKAEEVAAIATHIRRRWNGRSDDVTPLEVSRLR